MNYGKSGNILEKQEVASGGRANEPKPPVRSEYLFNGWYTDKACTVEYDFSKPVKSHITLYAKWTVPNLSEPKKETVGDEIRDIIDYNDGQMPEITFDQTDDVPSFIPGKFSDRVVFDSASAIEALNDIYHLMKFDNPYNEFVADDITESGGVKHYRLSQTYKGVFVYGKQLVVTTDTDGNIKSLSGDYDPGLEIDIVPAVTEDTAKQNLKTLKSWQNDVTSSGLTIYPVADGTHELAWELWLGPDQYFVSAVDGEVIAFFQAHGFSATDLNGNTRNINVTNDSRNGNILHDNVRNIYVFDDGGQGTELIYMYQLRQRSLGTTAIGERSSLWTTGVTAMANMAQTYDYYLNVLGRDSTNDNHARLNVWVNYGQQYDNAFHVDDNPQDDMSYFAFGDARDYVASVDVVAHEFTHGVTAAVNNLRYENESGALNEAYSDILGCLIEDREGENLWLFCEDLFPGAMRSLSSPNDYNQPEKIGDNYFQDYCYLGSDHSSHWCDNGGVHTNSGVFSHAAYLAYASGINDKQELARLFYNSMFYLSSNATFLDARAAVLQAANDMGLSASKIRILKDAFDEVGIVDPYDNVDENITNGLAGRVVSARDLSGIQGAAIIAIETSGNVLSGSGVGFTDSNGNFAFELPSGTYEILVSALGYKTITIGGIEVGTDGITYMENNILLDRIDESSGAVSYAGGKVVNALTGEPLDGVTIKFRANHSARSGAYVKDANGNDLVLTTGYDGKYYTTALPYGYYTLEASKTDYVTEYKNVYSSIDSSIGTSQDVTMNKEGVDSGEIRIVLEWGENPSDLDSHLVGNLASGDYFHVYFSDKNGYDGGGYLKANLDVDDTTSYGPETVTLYLDTDDTYRYYIHHYAGSGTISTSNARVRVYAGNSLIASFNAPTMTNSSKYWHVFDIIDGRIRPVNLMSSSDER